MKIDIYQKLKTNRITYEDPESKLKIFYGLLGTLTNTLTRKEYYKKRKREVLKYFELLYEGQRIILDGLKN